MNDHVNASDRAVIDHGMLITQSEFIHLSGLERDNSYALHDEAAVIGLIEREVDRAQVIVLCVLMRRYGASGLKKHKAHAMEIIKAQALEKLNGDRTVTCDFRPIIYTRIVGIQAVVFGSLRALGAESVQHQAFPA